MKIYDQSIQHIKKQRHYFAHKCLSSQCYGSSSSQVWMWELGHKEDWAPKNWCFWIVALEKTLESPLDCKEIKPVNPKGISPEYSFEGLMEAEAPIFWPPDVKGWLIRKDPDAGKDWGIPVFLGFPGGSDSKESNCNVGVLGSISGLARSPEERHGSPLQYSCVENSHRHRRLAGHSP